MFNLLNTDEVFQWVQQNFSTNREGDATDHTKHLAIGEFSVLNCSKEYVAAMKGKRDQHLIPSTWKENPMEISRMIKSIKEFDQLRNQSFEETFPELTDWYNSIKI